MGFHSSFCMSLSSERPSLSHQAALSNLPILGIHSPPPDESGEQDELKGPSLAFHTLILKVGSALNQSFTENIRLWANYVPGLGISKHCQRAYPLVGETAVSITKGMMT